MGVSQSRAAATSSAPSAPHQAARRTSSGGAVAPGNTRGVGCFPRRVPPKTRRATPRATADSSVALSDYSVQSRSREDVSQLLADLKGADTHCGYAIRDTHHLPRARPSRDAQLCTLPLRLPQADPPPPSATQMTGFSTPWTRSPRTWRLARFRFSTPPAAWCPLPSRLTREAGTKGAFCDEVLRKSWELRVAT